MIRREYHRRIAIAALLFLLILFVLGFAFLLPSYFLSVEKSNEAARSKELLDASLKRQEAESFSTLLRETKLRLQALRARAPTTSFSDAIALLVSRRTAGLRLDGFTVTRSGEDGWDFYVVGHASDRESLLAFAQDLRQEPRFSSVSVPVSNFAKPTDIAFSILLHAKP